MHAHIHPPMHACIHPSIHTYIHPCIATNSRDGWYLLVFRSTNPIGIYGISMYIVGPRPLDGRGVLLGSGVGWDGIITSLTLSHIRHATLLYKKVLGRT